jgi:hypothetical protein
MNLEVIHIELSNLRWKMRQLFLAPASCLWPSGTTKVLPYIAPEKAQTQNGFLGAPKSLAP